MNFELQVQILEIIFQASQEVFIHQALMYGELPTELGDLADAFSVTHNHPDGHAAGPTKLLQGRATPGFA